MTGGPQVDRRLVLIGAGAFLPVKGWRPARRADAAVAPAGLGRRHRILLLQTGVRGLALT